MNVLLLSARFPWPAYTGDRLRTQSWIAALARDANVALVAPDGDVPAHAPRFRFFPARRSIANTLRSAARVVAGAPFQSLLAAPYDWNAAITSAHDEFKTFDVTIVMLSRFDPLVRSHAEGFKVLDAIDSLRDNMDERARHASPLTRWVWRLESKRIARVEEDAARTYDRVIVVSEHERDALNAIVIANGVEVLPLGDAPRPYDFGFWGQLAYFANRDAAEQLVDELWPAIRARLPHATLFLGGANAPARIRAMHGRAGITVASPIADVAQLARSVKVALFPVRYGTGQSSKVLEAAEAGCAIVATSKAMRSLDPLHAHASMADDAFANAAVNMLTNDAHRIACGRALRETVIAHYSRHEMLRKLAALLERAEAAA